MKILLVDDDPFALKLLSRQLSAAGFDDVTTCAIAQDALALVERGAEPIGLIFCDLQMPGMDGVEFLRHLGRIGYQGGLVLVSGEDERILQTAHRLASAHQLDVLGALHKPIAPEALRAILDRLASRGAPAARPARHAYGAAELRQAITGQELVNHYQPKVTMASAAVTGVETLVRWQHPKDGLVFPDQFIGTAEEHGLIDDLTQQVLVQSLQQTRRWHDAGLPLQVAVNVSMDNLGNLEFADLVAREVDRAGVPPASLVLEVTESRLMKDQRVPLDIITRLRLKGIKLSIDDFGTGHSSLAQLRDIPFSELKVDRSFVHGACRDSSLAAILEGSVGMARQLAMKSVGEGVEDRPDWDYLRATGCDLAQGYFIARPMPGPEVAGWMAAWEGRRGELVQPTA